MIKLQSGYLKNQRLEYSGQGPWYVLPLVLVDHLEGYMTALVA